MGLLRCGVRRRRITLHNRIRENRTGIAGKLIPPSLCPGHIQIGGDLHNFFRSCLAKHTVQIRKFTPIELEGFDNSGILVQRRGDIREHSVDLIFREPLVQQGLDLGQQAEVFRQAALVHRLSEFRQLGKHPLPFIPGRHAVLRQQFVKLGHLVRRIFDTILIKHRSSNLLQRFRILHGSGSPVLGVPGVELVQLDHLLVLIGHEADQLILFIVLLIQFRVDLGHALRGGDHRILVHGQVCVLPAHGFGPSHRGLYLFLDGSKAIRTGGLQVILDYDLFPGVDKLLQTELLIVGKETVLPLLEQGLDLLVHGVKLFNSVRYLIGHGAVPGLLGSGFQFFQFFLGTAGQALPGFGPLFDDLIGLLLAVRPNSNQAIHPALRIGSSAGEILLGHTKGRQSFALAIESFSRSILPILSYAGHVLHGLFCLRYLKHIIGQGYRPGDYGDRNSRPHRGAFPQYGQETGDAAPGRTDGGSKGPEALHDDTDALADLSEGEDSRPDGCDNGRPFDDLLALSGIHAHELIQQVTCTVDQFPDGGIQVVADLLGEEHSFILQVGQLRRGGGIPLVGLDGQSRVFLPRLIRPCLRRGKKLGRVGRTEQGVAQADLADTDLIQGRNGALAFVVHPGQAHDERLERGGRIAVPQHFELLASHAAHLGEVLQSLPASSGRDLHFDQRFGERGTAHLGLDAHGGQGGGKAQHLCLGQANLLTGTGEPLCHLHDGLFRRGEVVAQVNDGAADVREQRLVGLHDVGELGNRRSRFVSIQVLAGVPQVNHDLRESLQVFRGYAQLAAGSHDLVNLRGRSGDLRRHLLGDFSQPIELFFRRFNGLPDGGE